MALIEKILGLGVIKPEWKQRFYSLLAALVALVELWWDVPDNWHTEAMLGKAALALAVIASFVLKRLRD